MRRPTASGSPASGARRCAARIVGLAALGALLAALTAGGFASAARHRRSHSKRRSAASATRVLRVGTFKGKRGRYKTIQGAVNAARPGDWILIGPGDYHETGDSAPAGRPDDTHAGGGVYVDKPKLHLRGMDRNRVIVDGSKPGAACPSNQASQSLGPAGKDGKPLGRNGVEVFKADGVSVENLTACNFLSGAGGGGNQVWFNGGDGSGKVGMGAYKGAYLSATTTFYADNAPAGGYGIFSSNARGPGLWAHTYASNMNDSSYYVGACPDCNMRITDAHAQNSALGYSGTNSGGHLIIESSEWDHNKTGIVSNSQNNDDAPSPQDGACPNTGVGPTGTHSCEVWRDNNVHDNNDPNVPNSGTAAAGPVGTGMVIAGGRDDVISHNRITNNGSWGILLVPYPDVGTPPDVANCNGGIQTPAAGGQTACYFDDWGNEVTGNTLSHNGFYGNPSNGDLAEVSNPETPGNCWHGNVRPAGEGDVSSEPPAIQTTHGQCGIPNSGDTAASTLGLEAVCATELLAPCPTLPVATYPRTTTVKLLALPHEASMPRPCAGVPANPWCTKARRHHRRHVVHRRRDPDHDGDNDRSGQG